LNRRNAAELQYMVLQLSYLYIAGAPQYMVLQLICRWLPRPHTASAPQCMVQQLSYLPMTAASI
jgi:hypothetical protein